ncbi:MAG: glycosyl hydrolase [Bacteroidota bacterium]
MRNQIKYLFILLLLIPLQSAAQTKLPAGYPDRTPSFDVLPGFINPPKGYGEVPFYWWQGDTLTRERLLWQLDQLKNKGISSLQINYSHLDSGGLTYGLSNPSKPALFTDSWWKLFKWFAAEAQNRNMTVSLSNYTLGIGQGFSMDEAIKENPDLNGSQLNYCTYIITGSMDQKLPRNLLALSGFKIDEDSSLIIETRKDLLLQVEDSSLVYDFGEETWKVIAVYSEKIIPSYDPMNPKSGKAYIKYFFEKFEKALPDKGSNALNFFFSDELNFRVSGNLWGSSFAEEFKKRKGYDIMPYLDALYINIGAITPRIKLDYNDVIVSLSEENFFKPVYQWHQDRGMIFGCDHGGRGKDVEEFGDYFRTQRWNQGPGSDQPQLSKDIIKAKVASSIAHLYNRPRVWLEGFHSSGWSTSSSDVTDAVFANYVAGYNLLSFHGLYYSTHGGWWEWAPPDNHFRMPYWKQIDPLMNCIQRLSYILSQGYHNCDVAIIYPTEPVIAEMDGDKSVAIAFETGEKLYDNGIDFDFIDFESLARSEVKNEELNVSGEKYKVLIVPSMKAIRYSSLKKIEEFKNAGGLIVNIGELPEATEKRGLNDAEISELVSEIFSINQNMIQCEDAKAVPSAISGKYAANFKILTGLKERPYVMHRIIGKRDVYALYNFPAGSRCFFKAKGEAQLWNPWNGEIASLSKFADNTGEGTELTLPLSDKEIQLIVFDSVNTVSKNIITENKIIRQTSLGNTWEFELKPSLDNQWGDFQLPAKNELSGAQARQLNFAEDKEYTGGKLVPDKTWKSITCGYGTQLLKIGALYDLPSEEELVKINPQKAGDEITLSGKIYLWEEYAFSWQYGVEGDYGHQGYHGLKGEMYDNFIRLGAMKDVKMSKERISEPAGNYYILYTSVIAPSDGTYDLLTGDVKPFILFVNNSKTDINSSTISLKNGDNRLLMVYNKACETYLIVREPGIPLPEKQPVSMCWYGDHGVLPFDCSFNNNSSGLFAFESAPGLRSVTFNAYGNVAIWIDGVESLPIVGQKQPDGLTSYSVSLKNSKLTSSQVVLKIEYQPGYSGAGSIPDYINQQCGKGSINLGDWSKIDGLKAYSGGAWYRKTIYIDAEDLKYQLEIDLRDIVSSAELYVNGKSAGIRLSPPWTFDITKFARLGNNQIEILIYNTLANNYTTIPTRYRGEIKSGLIGPVVLKLINRQ